MPTLFTKHAKYGSDAKAAPLITAPINNASRVCVASQVMSQCYVTMYDTYESTS